MSAYSEFVRPATSRNARPRRLRRVVAIIWLLTGLTVLTAPRVKGVPYASGLTNRNGTVFFRLNESADEVRIVSGNGAATNIIGALPAGLHVFALNIQEPFEVVVTKTSPAGFIRPVEPNRGAVLLISPNTAATRFFNPRGVAVNNNPASPHFGRIYIANAVAGSVTNTAFGAPRTVGDGLYALNPDFTDALGQGDQALTGGLDFATGRDLSPYRLTIGQDDQVYVCDFSDTNGGLYVVDANVTPGSGTNVLGGPAGSRFPVGLSAIHGSIAAAVVEGSLATSNLVAYVIDEDLQVDRNSTVRQTLNSLWRHELNASLPGAPDQMPELFTAPAWVGFVSQIMDLSRGPNGFFYFNTFRSPGTDWAGLYVHDIFGDPLWNSLTATRALLKDPAAADLLKATGGGAVSPSGDYFAVINQETSAITVLPLVDGIPDLGNHLVIEAFGPSIAQGRDVAWDLAGNLYAISAGAQSLRVFSPGGRTTAVTGSTGTFHLLRPPTVSVVATAGVAAEGGEPGFFSITRSGDLSQELIVSYTLTGLAERGSDYVPEPLSATFAPGVASAEVPIIAIDDEISEPVETVILTLVPSPDFDPRSPVSATITIADNDLPIVNLYALDGSAYERLGADTLKFSLERLGRTDVELFVRFSTAAGTAIRGVDYVIQIGEDDSTFFVLPAGQTNLLVTLRSIDDPFEEGDESVVVTLFGEEGLHGTGPSDTATGIIRDDDVSSPGVLFADDFDAVQATNWLVRFGANNGIYDADLRWAFDYGLLGIPPAPHSTSRTTLGLFLQVNKTNSAAGGSAGINLYPAGPVFSGNYALRFDMLFNLGTSSTTEHALAGLNHSGLLTNRVTQSTDLGASTRGGDGLFVAIESDASSNRDWAAYTFDGPDSFPVILTNRASASLAAVLPAPPYTFAGSPGIGPNNPRIWTEVELAQSNNVVSLRVNNSLIYSFSNSTSFNSGRVMIGLNDQFDSVGSGGLGGNFLLLDNVRVVSLDVPRIIRVELLPGGTIQIDFVCSFGGQPSEYRLEAASDLSAQDWTEAPGAVGSSTSSGFRFDAPADGGVRFYRVVR